MPMLPYWRGRCQVGSIVITFLLGLAINNRDYYVNPSLGHTSLFAF